MIASAYTYDGATTSVRTNVGKARSYGGEASFTIRPVRPMTINFGVALLDTKVTAIEAITAAEKARLGNDLPFAPNMTLNGSIRYEFALNDRMTLTPQVDARYVDAYYGDLDNTAPVGDFALVNARIDLRLAQAERGRIQIHVFTAGELRVEAGAQFKDGGHPPGRGHHKHGFGQALQVRALEGLKLVDAEPQAIG
jgi:iron complex outermembrane receptor protein